MLLSILSVTAIALTCAMFATRQVMLGFPCVIFWGILGGYCYQQSVTTWDSYYFLFFASMGMVIFSAYAMYGLRPEDISGPDADKGKYFDELKEPDLRGNISDELKPSRRRQALRDRADRRRSG